MKIIGLRTFRTESRQRVSDIAILLGTTCWRQVEATGRYLLVDRCSFGNTDEWVSLVWNGHGRRGNHCVPVDRGKRWDTIGVPVMDWQESGTRHVLCGQTESYSPTWQNIQSWYDSVRPFATHFRPHPAGNNPTELPSISDWHDVGIAITLNSSVGVDTVLRGIPSVAMDEGSMAWDVTSWNACHVVTPNRRNWLEWLAWTQWHHDEIRAGVPVRHIFEDL